jgi:hypothetical protein
VPFVVAFDVPRDIQPAAMLVLNSSSDPGARIGF